MVGSVDDVRTRASGSREVQALAFSDTHSRSVLSVSHTLTRGHTQSLSGAGSPWDGGGAGHLGYKAAIESRPRC